MRRLDLYALPDLHRSPWHEERALVRAALGLDIEAEALGIDLAAAEAEAEPALAFATKLRAPVDADRHLAYDVALLDGTPFALVVTGEDDRRAYVTDPALRRRARAYVEGFRTDAEPEAVDAGAEIPALDGVDHHRVAVLGGRAALLPLSRFAPSGRIVHDDDLFRESFDRIVRPAFGHDDLAFRQGGANARMRALVAEAVLAAVGEGVEASARFRAPEAADDGRRHRLAWVAALASDGRDAYAVGVPSYAFPGIGFSWVRSIDCVRIGPDALYRDLVAGQPAAPATIGA